MDWKGLERRLQAIPGVVDVHDLHVWSISSSTTAMTVHMRAYKPQEALVAAHKIVKTAGIQHATVQVQDAAAGNPELCLSTGCCGDHILDSKACVIASPAELHPSGFLPVRGHYKS